MTNQIDKLMALADTYQFFMTGSKDSDDARKALRDALEVALNPEGWRLVPVNATNVMCSRANASAYIDFEAAAAGSALTYDELRNIWKAMLAAAPTPPEAV